MRGFKSTLFVAISLLAVGSPALAQNATLAPVAAEARVSDALTFARAYVPESMIDKRAGADFDAGFDSEVAKSPQLARLESQFPGALTVMKAAGRAHVVKLLHDSMPRMHDNIARYVGANFSAAQQRELAIFFSSPAGQRLVETASDAVDSEKLVEDKADGTVTVKTDVKSLSSAIDYGFLGKLSKEEVGAAARFMGSPTGRIFNAKLPGLLEIIGKDTNAFIADAGSEAGAIMAQALQDHIAKGRRK